MENITALDKKNCTGCRMCEQLCPVKAIDMVENSEGFIEPIIDDKICINCGLCAKRCPQLNYINDNNTYNKKVYAAKNKNIEEQRKSSSGGIFSAIANYVLEKNGIVFGCIFNDKIEAEHIGVYNKKDLEKLRGSKYVQSNTKDTFKETKKSLEEGKMVLYTGTPCQIAGLKAFLGKEYDCLITVDLVCHGVPSPKLLKKYIQWIEEKNKSKVIHYEFRNKEKNGWGLNAKIVFENGKIKYTNARLDPYYKTFLESLDYREVCYNCKYANCDRVGDITLADYWGIEKEHPAFIDENGVSAVLINSFKGESIIKKILDKVDLIPTTLNQVTTKNGNLKKASERDEKRNGIYDELDTIEFDKYIKEKMKFIRKKKDLIKWIIPQDIKKRIKKIAKR